MTGRLAFLPGMRARRSAVPVLLASDEARFMTGSSLIIDGGMSL